MQIVENDPAGNCAYRGELSGYVLRYDHSFDVMDARTLAMDGYQTLIRNKTAEMGGDTAVLLARRHDASIFYDVFSVYSCA